MQTREPVHVQASILELRRLEALCETIQLSLQERQAEVEKLQAKVRQALEPLGGSLWRFLVQRFCIWARTHDLPCLCPICADSASMIVSALQIK